MPGPLEVPMVRKALAWEPPVVPEASRGGGLLEETTGRTGSAPPTRNHDYPGSTDPQRKVRRGIGGQSRAFQGCCTDGI